ncbi:MAG: hypothetical protein K8S00_14115 [Bacteroidales bacterium]|nr:hypothetical protein [Bacteroidales bacterium]
MLSYFIISLQNLNLRREYYMDFIDPDEPLIDDYPDDDFEESREESRPLIDEDFMEEDLLEDEINETISDEYDEEFLNDEGFHIENSDQEDNLFNKSNGFELDDYDD